MPNAKALALRDLWETHPAKAVVCPRCKAQPGEPCVSCMGNVTLPHIPRITAAARDAQEAAHA